MLSILAHIFMVAGESTQQVATGISFTETFRIFDESLWYKDVDHLHCVALDSGDYDATRCVHRLTNNVNIHHDKGDRPYSELQITMRSDCRGQHCCTGGTCTKFNSGAVMSEETFSYGSFRFIARLEIYAGFMESKMFDAVACFGLEKAGKNDKGQVMHGDVLILMCICAKEPKTILVMCAKEKFFKKKYVQIGHSVTDRSLIYRIDWHPNSISWFINGDEIYSMTSPEDLIPQHPLRIKIFVFPKVISDAEIDAEDHEMMLRVLRIAYRKLGVKDHTELLVHQNSGSFPMMTLSFCFISCLLYMLIMRIIAHFTQPENTMSTDYHTYLLSDSLILNEQPTAKKI